MRSAVLAAGVLLLAFATAANAQWRGALSSRPAAPATASRPPAPLPIFLPVWPQWGVVMLPETTVSPPRIGEGGPTDGVQLDIQPWRAQVFVDGVLAGLVEEFRGYYQHLELTAGAHRIAIVATGYEPHLIDVMVVPGKTLTYRATLR